MANKQNFRLSRQAQAVPVSFTVVPKAKFGVHLSRAGVMTRKFTVQIF